MTSRPYTRTLNDLAYARKEWSDLVDGYTTDGATFYPPLQALGYKEGDPVEIVGSGPPRQFIVTASGATPSPKYRNRHAARKAAKLARSAAR
jgi:hypothetical protein